MKVGVIGGSGFIGSHVVDKLVDAGHDVTVFDIMTPHRSDVRHIVADILDGGRTTVALAGEYDAIYLLAAVANVNDVYHIPVESMQTNVMAVANVLEGARRTGAKRVILASTAWVYGMSDRPEVDEETPLSVNSVNHVYTASKVSAEMLCHSYSKLYKLDTTILRYGIPYGPRARMGTVLATFVNRAMKGQPIVIQGDGSAWRNFVYVEDLALGNVAALQDAAKNQTFNLEGSERTSVRQIADMVKEFFPKADIRYVEARAGDLAPKIVSNKKAEQLLGWKPTVSFEDGAARYIRWAQESLQAQKRPALAA